MPRTLFQRSFYSSNISLEWKIDDFCNRNVSSASLDSETFDFSGFQWKLSLEKNAFLSTCENPHFSIALIKLSPLEASVNLRIQSYIEDRYKKIRYCEEEYFNTSSEESKRVWMMGLSLQELQSSLLANGAITFIFNLTSEENQLLKKKDVKGVQTSTNAESEASAESLAVDFRRLLDNGTHSDVTLKSGDVTIPAHRLILSARSEVFAAMLRSDMEESRSGIVEISDIDPPVLCQMVQFIYSGKLSDLTMETASQLFAAGDKYAVETLKRQCSAFIKENLAEGGACSILVLADAHSDKDLRECAITYIMDTELTQNDDVWPRSCDDHPKLAIEVFTRICKAAKSLKQ